MQEGLVAHGADLAGGEEPGNRSAGQSALYGSSVVTFGTEETAPPSVAREEQGTRGRVVKLLCGEKKFQVFIGAA